MTTLLIDGDVVLYRAATVVEKPIHWGDDLWTLHSDALEAKQRVLATIQGLEQKLKAERVIFTLSDKPTFRHFMEPSYKANRTARKPICYKALVEWALANFECPIYPALEADDVMGILATDGSVKDPVVVTIDKDLKGVPCAKHFNPDKDDKPRSIDHTEAERFFMCQVLAGDPTDGYPGVKGIGMKTAVKLFEKNGWNWATIVAAYEKAGLGEEFALLQARLAKILTADCWDKFNQQVIPWTPEMLEVCV